MNPKRIVVLGSTGSIGRQVLDVVRSHPQRLRIVGLAAGRQVEELAAQAREFGADACIRDPAYFPELQRLAGQKAGRLLADETGLCELVQSSQADLVIAAISGLAGLLPLMAALEAGKDVALANKEPLVAAGALVTTTADRVGAQLLPIDSEISAIFQALKGEDPAAIEKLILTASGGPFACLSMDELHQVTPAQALKHPTWRMGRKVTIDSATLANKGFEVFELHWLFGIPFDNIEVIIHHQSIIHSAIQFCDGSIIAQLGLPDMRIAIQYAMLHPERVANDFPRLDLAALGRLTFARPDVERFPCLRLAFEAGKAGQTYPAVLNGANEEAVALFLEGRIGFFDIPRAIEEALEAHDPAEPGNLDNIMHADAWAREQVRRRFGVITSP
ncbi:MAG: 1-deoxy-D-xylulose-5-phosphate reductoisomerase [Candidatus Zipacnadales bacterium]